MQDWIEFKKNETDNLSLRPEYIVGISEFPFDMKNNLSAYTRVLYDIGNSAQDIAIAEPYEQVRQKIMDAEKVDLSDVVVERFTKEEYKFIEKSLYDHYGPNTYSKEYNSIMNKTSEILKEDK